jgi:hypothetical protein
VAAPDAGAAKLGDTAQTPMPKPTNAAMKIARMSFSLLLEGRRPSASHGLAFGDRVLRSEIRPAAPRCIRRSAARQIAPYRDDKRHWRKSSLRSQNSAWLNHSSLVHGLSWH